MPMPIVGRPASVKKPANARRKRIVVHLGNVEEIPLAAKSKRLAERFPGINFVGIDLMALHGERPKNLRQIRADFVSGLKKLRDNSVFTISSELSFGLFPAPEEKPRGKTWSNAQKTAYAAKALVQAYAKLEPGGKLLVAIDKYNLQPLKAALKKSAFKAENIQIREFEAHEYERSFWAREMKSYPILYQVTAIK